MSNRKISIVFTEYEWRIIAYLLGTFAGDTKRADAIEEQIEEQIIKQKAKKKKL